jgi:CARDB
MRRTALACLVAAALVAPAAAPAEGAAATPSRTAAGVRLTACDTAPAEAAFEGRMRAVVPGQRLQMRFTLQVSTPDAPRWRAVPAPGFGAWYTADAGVTRWTYAKRVQDLLVPASYRALVRFRWRDAHGRIVARDVATSLTCRQPDLRPDLRSGTVTAAAAAPGAAYVIKVRNAGRGPSGATRLTLATGGSVLQAAVPALPAGEEKDVTVTGPRCAAGSELVLVLDPDGRVEERSEEDNRRTLACPAGASG